MQIQKNIEEVAVPVIIFVSSYSYVERTTNMSIEINRYVQVIKMYLYPIVVDKKYS